MRRELWALCAALSGTEGETRGASRSLLAHAASTKEPPGSSVAVATVYGIGKAFVTPLLSTA